ncbi:MAG: hypothetical protein OQJ89_08720 [Kangiellaceae bacterium]|nr:hypothetical protein [Kangiellaceae bacterium]MCW8999867.1 hypothetical protein [Kangiellaceae bacterium]MCW9017032.1 hypothetical protein [Kangiellaceae bacterium]
MKLFNSKKQDNFVIASLEGQHCRIQHFKLQENKLIQLAAKSFLFTSVDQLAEEFIQVCREQSLKSCCCRWMLSRDHYQTHTLDRPKVTEKEMNTALKWQIKDLLEQPVEDVLVGHYQPMHPDKPEAQVIAVVVERDLIVKLIEMSRAAGLEMDSIEIDELCIGNAFLEQLTPERITGFVGEDSSGLIFNFYNGQNLCFSRYKKGRFMPTVKNDEEFVLDDEQEAQEESFLLETQRTLDYVISQIFRRPLDSILLQQRSANDQQLADTINQITEIPVQLIEAPLLEQPDLPFLPTLAEAGCALRGDESR